VVIEHCIHEHQQKELKYAFRQLNEQTGKPGYIKKCFDVTPQEIKRKGQCINVNDNHTITINEDRDCAGDSETNTKLSKQVEYLTSLLPSVVEAFDNAGFLDTFISFFQLVSEKQFPMDNISFRLFLDVVHYFSIQSTTSMTYSEASKMFWRTGWKLFHGKFLRFMSGPKNQGQIVDGIAHSGYLNPLESKINFAVPNVQSLQSEEVIKSSTT
jgi:hypothetical protein